MSDSTTIVIFGASGDLTRLEALDGDPMLFTRADSIEHVWRTIDPIMALREYKGLAKCIAYDVMRLHS